MNATAPAATPAELALTEMFEASARMFEAREAEGTATEYAEALRARDELAKAEQDYAEALAAFASTPA